MSETPTEWATLHLARALSGDANASEHAVSVCVLCIRHHLTLHSRLDAAPIERIRSLMALAVDQAERPEEVLAARRAVEHLSRWKVRILDSSTPRSARGARASHSKPRAAAPPDPPVSASDTLPHIKRGRVEVRTGQWDWIRVCWRDGVMSWRAACAQAERLARETGRDHRAVEVGKRIDASMKTYKGGEA